MGYVKYKEDDREISNERKYNKKPYDYLIEKKNNETIIKSHKCIYCDSVFSSIDNRNFHIREEHNVMGPLLFINGKLVDETKIYIKSVEDIFVDFCGFKEITIIFNGCRIEYDKNNYGIRLKKYIISDDLNTIEVGNKKIDIIAYPKMDIRSPIISNIIESWEKEVIKGSVVLKEYPKDLNVAEKHYLDGIYNYYLACVSGSDKKKRYEDAYSILKEFEKQEPKALCILRVIAFRLNWVEKLKNVVGLDNTFLHAWSFLSNKSDNYKNRNNILYDQKLFIEDQLEQILDAIVSYQKGELNKVKEYLNHVNETDDSNLNDKIYLLKARMARKQEMYDVAKTFYNEIKTPYFEKEKQDFFKIH